MSSRGKKRTTMAKLDRETRRRERRDHKQARKDARRDTAAAAPLSDVPAAESGEDAAPATGSITKETP
jgi:hypothetical protein